MHLKIISAIIKGEGENMFINVTTHADQKPKINTDLIVAIMDKQVHFAGGLALDLDDESIEKVHNIVSRGRNKAEVTEDNKDLIDLFGKLHTLTGGKGKPIFNVKRQNQLKFLLDPKKGGMTKEQIIQAATNIGKDAFLQGDNDSKKRYGDVDYLLRQDKASKWAEATPEKKKGMF